MPKVMNIQEVKIYFQTANKSYTPDTAFENLLKLFKGKELDLKDQLRFAPVAKQSNGGYIHAITPIPSGKDWPKVACHEPFELEGLEGKYTLLFTGQVMDSNGKLKAGTCTSFDDIFLKLLPVRDVSFLRVPDNTGKMDLSLLRF